MLGILTIHEVEPKDRSIGESPVVYRLSRTYDLISKCHQIAHCRARADILQVLANWSPLAPLSKHGHLPFGVVQSRIEVLHFLVGEVGSNCGVDTRQRSPLPKINFLFKRSEACHSARAADTINACMEGLRGSRTKCGNSCYHGGPTTRYRIDCQKLRLRIHQGQGSQRFRAHQDRLPKKNQCDYSR